MKYCVLGDRLVGNMVIWLATYRTILDSFLFRGPYFATFHVKVDGHVDVCLYEFIFSLELYVCVHNKCWCALRHLLALLTGISPQLTAKIWPLRLLLTTWLTTVIKSYVHCGEYSRVPVVLEVKSMYPPLRMYLLRGTGGSKVHVLSVHMFI